MVGIIIDNLIDHHGKLIYKSSIISLIEWAQYLKLLTCTSIALCGDNNSLIKYKKLEL